MEKRMPKEFLKTVEILTKFIDEADRKSDANKAGTESEKKI